MNIMFIDKEIYRAIDIQTQLVSYSQPYSY